MLDADFTRNRFQVDPCFDTQDALGDLGAPRDVAVFPLELSNHVQGKVGIAVDDLTLERNLLPEIRHALDHSSIGPVVEP